MITNLQHQHLWWKWMKKPHLNVVLVPETVCDCYRLLSQFCECIGVLELSFCCCYEDCNLNRTINALWLRQPHYNPLFTGTTEAAVRRWDGSSALSHRASADCAISVLPRPHNVPYFPAGAAFLFSFHSSARFPPAPVSLYRHRTAGRISRVFNGTSWLLL